MKGKKYKRSQHYVKNVYEKYFGIRKSYQVLVDAPFCIETLKIKIAPMEAITEVFGGTVKLMTTPCIQSELQAYDRQNDAGAVFVARRFEVRRCQHDKGSKTGSECVRDLISTNNPHHYCVAGQDLELRKELRKIAGVPLIFILRDTVVMEAPTDKTIEITRKIENKKLKKVDLDIIKKVTDKMISSLSKANDHDTESLDINKSKLKKKKKQSKEKNPNPLSCKKPKKFEDERKAEQKLKEDTVQAKVKRARKRRPKKKNSTNAPNTIEAN